VAVNCAALTESLIESELFGHERGAFTGAASSKAGRFELADGGSLFLDEVGELPLSCQTKFLRVLGEICFDRMGGGRDASIEVDVRVVAATNRDLATLVDGAASSARTCIYRLSVITDRRSRRCATGATTCRSWPQHFLARYSASAARRIVA
jgi:transcriptional regulator with GAF, ATPase, and Fis domain